MLQRVFLQLAFVSAAATLLPALSAQTSAQLSGLVTDSSGAAIAEASVTAKNSSTGASRMATTDSSGRYQFSALPVGEYEVLASKSGFGDEVHRGIDLVVGQAANVDFKLNVGQTNQTVTVTGDAPLVDASTADISGLVGHHEPDPKWTLRHLLLLVASFCASVSRLHVRRNLWGRERL